MFNPNQPLAEQGFKLSQKDVKTVIEKNKCKVKLSSGIVKKIKLSNVFFEKDPCGNINGYYIGECKALISSPIESNYKFLKLQIG